MVFIFGSRMVGDVDQTDDGFAVSTLFVHCMGIPVVPMRSFVMKDRQRVERVPLRMKSVIAAWLRTFLVVVAAFYLLGGTIRLIKGAVPDGIVWLAIGSVPALLYRGTRRWFRAPHQAMNSLTHSRAKPNVNQLDSQGHT
jgi:hypothetical protein